jgi:hypothetical protein
VRFKPRRGLFGRCHPDFLLGSGSALRLLLYKLTPPAAARTYRRAAAYSRQESERRPKPQVNQMFCPRCGQQSSDEVRFCPRCGLSLAGLTAYVAGNEFGPARLEAPRPAEMTAKRRATRRGAKLMFFSVVLFPIFLGLGILVDNPIPLFVPFMVFLTGLVMVVYSLLFGDELIQLPQRAGHRDLGGAGDRPSLGAAQFNPAPLFNQQRNNTAEIYQPPSITENTTKLLDKDS